MGAHGREHVLPEGSRICVAGAGGLVGSALLARLSTAGQGDVLAPARSELDLADAAAVDRFFTARRPDYVLLTAGRVGGIAANQAHPAQFIHENLAIQAAVVHAAYRAGVRRLLVFACACAYPRDARQPMAETDLLTGPLEPTSEAFAVAKLAGMKMCEAYNQEYGTAFLSVIPASVYGPGDTFDLERAHVLSALLRKFDEARRTGGPVVVWGSGEPRREFIFAEDLADACLALLGLDERPFRELTRGPAATLNVGVGEDVSIRALAGQVGEIVGFGGEVQFDRGRPDGAPRKLLDSRRLLALGWRPQTSLKDGIRQTYEWYNRRGLCSKTERDRTSRP